MSLSDMQCKTAKPADKPYKLFDGEGLYLEVMHTGAKHWRLKYRMHNKEKRISFGPYPQVSLSEARQKKNASKEELKLGIDPVLKRTEKTNTAAIANETIFKNIALEWYETQLASWDSKHAKTILHRMEKYIFRDLGNFPISMIKPLTILSCIQKIERTAPEMV